VTIATTSILNLVMLRPPELMFACQHRASIAEFTASALIWINSLTQVGHVDQVADLQLAYPTFTEGVSMAAQKICRAVGIGHFPQAWSYLGSEE